MASGDKFALTPVYHVFKMYMAHMGATAIRTEFAAPQATYDRLGKTATLWGLNGSASVSGKKVTLTVVNPHSSRMVEAEIVVRGASVAGGRGQVLTSGDLHAHNDFERPDAVHPEAAAVTVSGGRVVHRFPAASVTALDLTLG